MKFRRTLAPLRDRAAPCSCQTYPGSHEIGRHLRPNMGRMDPLLYRSFSRLPFTKGARLVVLADVVLASSRSISNCSDSCSRPYYIIPRLITLACLRPIPIVFLQPFVWKSMSGFSANSLLHRSVLGCSFHIHARETKIPRFLLREYCRPYSRLLPANKLQIKGQVPWVPAQGCCKFGLFMLIPAEL